MVSLYSSVFLSVFLVLKKQVLSPLRPPLPREREKSEKKAVDEIKKILGIS